MRKTIGFLLLVASSALAQDLKPNFAGTWKLIGGNRPVPANPILERITQTDSTISISGALNTETADLWVVYPTNGRETKKIRGRITETSSGRWEGTRLVLEVTRINRWGVAEYHGPHTTREILSLSDDGRIMTSKFHNLKDDPRLDVEFICKRVDK